MKGGEFNWVGFLVIFVFLFLDECLRVFGGGVVFGWGRRVGLVGIGVCGFCSVYWFFCGVYGGCCCVFEGGGSRVRGVFCGGRSV